MNDFNIGNEVEFFNTSDETLDGERGVIVGRYSNSFIVIFAGSPIRKNVSKFRSCYYNH